jgi:hypothetical protein
MARASPAHYYHFRLFLGVFSHVSQGSLGGKEKIEEPRCTRTNNSLEEEGGEN